LREKGLDFGGFLAGANPPTASVLTTYINSGFWIGDFGLLIPEFARLPAIGFGSTVSKN
jgi:hypothetical protein